MLMKTNMSIKFNNHKMNKIKIKGNSKTMRKKRSNNKIFNKMNKVGCLVNNIIKLLNIKILKEIIIK